MQKVNQSKDDAKTKQLETKQIQLQIQQIDAQIQQKNGYVLISLLAVFHEYRGQGIGSESMKELRVMYENKQAIIVEVERPDFSQTPEECDSRKRRIEFYEKAGFYLIPNIDYSIWDVPMHLMAMPLTLKQ